MAGVTPADIDACEFYDCFTYTVEATLRDYGFFKKEQVRDFITRERLAPGGSLPVNTSGGMLSEAYFMGLTPLAESVHAADRPLRRSAARQAGRNEGARPDRVQRQRRGLPGPRGDDFGERGMSMTEFFEPRISADTKAYWDGCREHKLMVQKCKACGRLRIPASYVCQNCLSTETELVEMKTEGTLYSFVVMHRAFHPSVQDKVPYIVATIDLSEDVRILGKHV